MSYCLSLQPRQLLAPSVIVATKRFLHARAFNVRQLHQRRDLCQLCASNSPQPKIDGFLIVWPNVVYIKSQARINPLWTDWATAAFESNIACLRVDVLEWCLNDTAKSLEAAPCLSYFLCALRITHTPLNLNKLRLLRRSKLIKRFCSSSRTSARWFVGSSAL